MISTEQLKPRIRVLKTEFAEWESANGQWHAPRRTTSTHFRADGSISESEDTNPDGSVAKSLYLYDDAGKLLEVRFQLNDGPLSLSRHYYDDFGRPTRKTILQPDGTEHDSEVWRYDLNGSKTKVQFVSEIKSDACGTAFGVEGAQAAYGASNVAEIETVYDEREHASEALFYDSDRGVVMRIVLGRDSAGRLISEDSRAGDKPPFLFEEVVANTSAEERAETEAALAQLFGQQNILCRTTYVYDDRGRQVERYRSMFGMSEEHTTWQYDEHDNPTREVQESVTRDIQSDKSGSLQPTQEKSFKSEFRLDYKYDGKGNWIEKVVSFRSEGSLDFQRSNIERREISYWSDEE